MYEEVAKLAEKDEVSDEEDTDAEEKGYEVGSVDGTDTDDM